MKSPSIYHILIYSYLMEISLDAQKPGIEARNLRAQ